MLEGMRRSAGGVVIHPDGDKVLLRKPAQNPGYDDLQWTHAKGGLDGQSPEEAALREVEEEMGVQAIIVAEIPGWFSGSTTMNKYYVMQWVSGDGVTDEETEDVRWFTWDEAESAMRTGSNTGSIERDITVLRAAQKIFNRV